MDARNYDNTLPIFNAETGDLLIRQPTPGVLRLRRSAFRELIAEGLDIQVCFYMSMSTAYGRATDSKTESFFSTASVLKPLW